MDSIITNFPGNPSRKGLRIPDVSRHQMTGSLTVGRPDVVQATLQVWYLSHQVADDLNRQPIEDFIVLDASLRKRIASCGGDLLNGENLTDRQYIATQTGGIRSLGQPLLILGGLRIDL